MLELLATAALFGQEFNGERIDCRRTGNDIATRVCYAWFQEREEARMQRYLQAAVDAAARRRVEAADAARRLGAPDDDPDPLEQERAWIQASDAAFAAYRQMWCNGVYEAYGRGTTRDLAQADCEIELTHERTKVIWRDFLNSDAEPVLPEPVRRAWEDEAAASPPDDADE